VSRPVGSSPGPRSRRRRTALDGITSRVVLTTAVTAVAAVAVTAAVGLGSSRSAYDAPARAVLHREALLLAPLVDTPAGAPGRPLRQALHNSRIRVVRVAADGAVAPRTLLSGTDPVAVSIRAAAAAAADTGARAGARTVRLAGQRYLVDVEPVPSGGAVVLLERVADVRAVANGTARDVAWAGLLGLVLAVGLGTALSRRLTRPLVRAAAGARELAAGRRDLRLDTTGPTEVAAVSSSLNTVAENLSRTEGRQREFLLAVSHELRTPLTAIRGFSEAIADRVAVGADAAAAGRTILDEADRLAGLVSDLLELARSGTSDFRVALADVDLVPILTAAAAAWADRARARGLALRLEVPDGPVRAWTDVARVRQIVDALTDNAVRASPPGATVVLAVRRGRAGGAGPEVEVRDGGPGLSATDYPVAFDRGVLHERYRDVRGPGGAATRGPETGSGVGLALVGSLAARLGGRALAGPAPEGGAAFTVQLPAGPPTDR